MLTTRPADGYVVEASRTAYTGKVFGVRVDEVRMPDGSVAVRDIVTHQGAVAVVALDEDDRVVLIEQYRHSARGFLWELPAGILDVAGEPAVVAAQRELAEEVGLAAAEWWTLLDVRTAVGFSDEAVRIFLARGLSDAAADGFVKEGEEADLVVRRVPLAECVTEALAGRIENALCVAGVLAAAAAGDPAALRPADAPWPARPTA